MPHLSLKLNPGANLNQTPAFNEAGISNCNLIRFIPESGGFALVQPIGGWSQFYTNPVPSVVRSLWAWSAPTTGSNYLAVGATGGLGVVVNWQSLSSTGALLTITPQTSTVSSTLAFTTVANNSAVTIVDSTGTAATNFTSVYIQTPVAIGGLTMFGLYACTGSGSGTYTVVSQDVLGNPLPAPSSAGPAGAVAQYVATSGSNQVVVNFAAHGYSIGSSYPVIVATVVGTSGITIAAGEYSVLAINSPSQFTIQATSVASASDSAYQNSGNAQFRYFFGAGALAGYGIGAYGAGGYGIGTASGATPGTPITATDWSLANWGNILISCATGGPIYTWDPTQNQSVSSVIPQAPTVNAGLFVAMPQRQIVAWGSTFDGVQDRLLVRWCDVENYSSWIATSVNQAGSYRIPRGSLIVGGIQAPQQGLLWTDVALWTMQYISQPYIYSFNEVGTGCGLIAPKAAATLNGVVYWMAQSQFFTLAGSGVQPLVCPVWDAVFQDLDGSNLDKIRVAPNARFGEIAWYYPTVTGNGEVTNYVKFNTVMQTWDFGVLGRTAWVDQSIFGPPIGADPVSGYLYQHETSTTADGSLLAATFTTGLFALNEGDQKAFVDEVWPDMKWGYYGGNQNASVQMTFSGSDFPSQAPLTYGPYTFTTASTFISPRLRARLLSITVSSTSTNQGFWRLGNIRYRAQPDGKY